MKVRDLIIELSEANPDAEVMCWARDGDNGPCDDPANIEFTDVEVPTQEEDQARLDNGLDLKPVLLHLDVSKWGGYVLGPVEPKEDDL
jgi:hypothetical protein